MTYSSDTTGSEFGRSRPAATPAAAVRAAANVIRRAFAAGGDMVAYALHWRRVSWTIERLSALDDASLRDIGIGRSEIVPTAYRIAYDEWEARRRITTSPKLRKTDLGD